MFFSRGTETISRKCRKKSIDTALAIILFRTSIFFDLQATRRIIGEKQFEAFRAAIDHGYYQVPRRVTLSELSQKLGKSPSTVSEHLRKTESKVLPAFWEVISRK